MVTLDRQQQVTPDVVARIISDPVIYAEVVLGVTLWSKQKEILMAMMSEPLVAVKACHGSGKTFMLAVFVLWWMTRYKYRAKVITLAPTERQVRTILWSEINALYDRSELAQLLLDNAICTDTQLRVTANSFAKGVSGSTTTSLQGYHAEHLLVCIDEGPGVQYEFFEALHGARAGGVSHLVMMGNPTENSGLFYEAFTRPEMRWKCFTISGFDSPNIKSVDIPESWTKTAEYPGVDDLSDRRLLSYLINCEDRDDPMLNDNEVGFIFTRRNLVEYYHLWGITNQPSWYSRALGMFAPEGVDALIRYEWLVAASGEEAEYDVYGPPVILGIDVAAQGEDDTVIVGVQGGKVFLCQGFSELNPFNSVLTAVAAYCENLFAVHIDIAGTGYHFALRLAEALHIHYPDVQIIGINVGVRAGDPVRFVNLRSQVFWNLREIMEGGRLSGIESSKLKAELLSLRWRENERDQIALETKKEMKKRGLSSPDYADALALALWPAIYFAELSMFIGDEGMEM